MSWLKKNHLWRLFRLSSSSFFFFFFFFHFSFFFFFCWSYKCPAFVFCVSSHALCPCLLWAEATELVYPLSGFVLQCFHCRGTLWTGCDCSSIFKFQIQHVLLSHLHSAAFLFGSTPSRCWCLSRHCLIVWAQPLWHQSRGVLFPSPRWGRGCHGRVTPREAGQAPGCSGATWEERLVHSSVTLHCKGWAAWCTKPSHAGERIGFLCDVRALH